MNSYLHYTYKISFDECGSYYFGKHSTKQLKDRYKGSGVKLTPLIKQGKRYSFEIIALHETSDAAFIHEEILVGEKYRTDPLCLNRIRGGSGIRNFSGKPGNRTPRKDKQKVLISARLGAEARRGMKDSPEVNARRSASVRSATLGVPKPWICKRFSIDNVIYIGLDQVCKTFSVSRYIARTRFKSAAYPTWETLPK